MPKVSVILPVYNAQKYLKCALDSLLQQSFLDFEIIVVDDHSTDGSLDIIKSFVDNRILLISNPENFGVAKTLNIGLSYAAGEYIARFDADDIAISYRFAQQVSILNSHEDIGVVTSYIEVVNEKGESQGIRKLPLSSSMIKKLLEKRNVICHPSVLFRKKVLTNENYDELLNGAEDYDLWLRLAKKTEFYCIPEVLTQYRITRESVSYKNIYTKAVSIAHTKAIIKSILCYKYPLINIRYALKSFLLVFLPSYMKKLIYEKAFGY